MEYFEILFNLKIAFSKHDWVFFNGFYINILCNIIIVYKCGFCNFSCRTQTALDLIAGDNATNLDFGILMVGTLLHLSANFCFFSLICLTFKFPVTSLSHVTFFNSQSRAVFQYDKNSKNNSFQHYSQA